MGLLPPTIAVVTQPTRLEGLVARWATRSAAKFRLKQAVVHERARNVHLRVGASKRAAETTAELAEDQEAGEAAFASYEQEDRAQQRHARPAQEGTRPGLPVEVRGAGVSADLRFPRVCRHRRGRPRRTGGQRGQVRG